MNVPIESLCFNDDNSRFIVGTDNGFWVYDTDPYKYVFSRDCFFGGLKIVKVFGKSGTVLFVGTGKNPLYPTNAVFIWDDSKNDKQQIAKITCKEEIKNIIPMDPLLAITTNNLVMIFHMKEDVIQLPSHVIDADTHDCVLLKNQKDRTMLVYPSSTEPGKIIIQKYFNDNGNIIESNMLGISAHNSKIKKIALSMDGNILVTCSVKGTILRLFDTSTGEKINELRRGSFQADIIDLCFSPKSDYISVVSNSGTLHIFSANISKDKPVNKKSTFNFIPGFLPLGSFLSSEWSCAQISLDPEWIESGIILTFGQKDNTLIVIVKNGKYVRYVFHPNGPSIEKDKEDRWYNT